MWVTTVLTFHTYDENFEVLSYGPATYGLLTDDSRPIASPTSHGESGLDLVVQDGNNLAE